MNIYKELMDSQRGLTTMNTVAAGSASNGYYHTSPATVYTTGPGNQANDLTLAGGADLKIDGVSLREFMQTATQRLNMLVPNPELEKQWAELKALGDAYRALEKECLDKAQVWSILNRP